MCLWNCVFASKTSGPSKRIAMNIKRFLESANETARKKAKKRALEDEYQLLRNNSDRACTAKKRASETHDESLCIKESDRACAAKKRASETSEEYSQSCDVK